MKVKIIIIAVLLLTISFAGCVEDPKTLDDILLNKGGIRLNQDCGDLFEKELIENGVFIVVNFIFEQGVTNGCHLNAYQLWELEFSLYTGYALTSDGWWICHSWVFMPEKDLFIETTVVYEKYYGICLTDEQVKLFKEEHILGV